MRFDKVVMAGSPERVQGLQKKYPDHYVAYFTTMAECYKFAGAELRELVIDPDMKEMYLMSRLRGRAPEKIHTTRDEVQIILYVE